MQTHTIPSFELRDDSGSVPLHRMARSLARRRAISSAVSLLALLALQGRPASAIAVSLCSSENTGADSTPTQYDLNSLGYCRDNVCQGRAFAITQDDNCWCSDYAPVARVSTGSCDLPCPGFPYEFCGSAGGDFSYLLIGVPSGTTGAPTSSATRSASTQAATTIVVPQETTLIQTQTVVSTTTSDNVVIRTTAIIRTSEVFETSIVTLASQSAPQTVTKTVPVTTGVKPSSSSTGLVPVTIQQTTSISGTLTTRLFTTLVPPSSPLVAQSSSRSSGLSGGAIAGIVIGAIAGLLLIGGLVFFCLRRRRADRGAPDDGFAGGSGVHRGYGAPSTAAVAATTATHVNARSASRPPRLNVDIPHMTEAGSSTGSVVMERRDSRPMFVDSRLNTDAVMLHSDTSHASLHTLADNHDYSRPLKVRNP